jgi:hypothetical protein
MGDVTDVMNVGLAIGAFAFSCVWMFDLTPSTKFSSAAVDVTLVPAICKVVAFT